MEATRKAPDAPAFLAAVAALGATGLFFLVDRNGAACVMVGFCIAGLVGARLAGVPGTTLLPVAVGLALILYVGWVYPPGGPRRTSFFAHVGGAALLGWALGTTLRARMSWPSWGWAALATVAALAVAWELGEYVADAALDTALIPSSRDSAQDIAFGLFGAALGVAAAWLLARRRIASAR